MNYKELYGGNVLTEYREKAPIRKARTRMGMAVCDMKGSLWELDADFLGYMKQIEPSWSGGELPADMMTTLKNTGCYQVADIRLQAEPKENGKIMLKLQKML